MKHLITLGDWSSQSIVEVIEKGIQIKNNPNTYSKSFANQTLVMLFEKPSLRTRISFEIAAVQMGGHALYYDLSNSPFGKGKESMPDTVKVLSRYANVIMARLYSHQVLVSMAKHATIPVINGLTNFSHPCQILADLMTVKEKKGSFDNLKLAYCGDSCNNVTHSLMYGCSKLGISIAIACPEQEEYCPSPGVLQHTTTMAKENGSNVTLHHNAEEAIADADVVYTDSWMSYHIAEEEQKQRVATLKKFQVTQTLLKLAKKDVVFMNCLPAARGYEQTAEVIDGPHSVVFDQVENRLHVQKAIILFCLEL